MKKTISAFVLLFTCTFSFSQNNFTRTKVKPEYSSWQYTNDISFQAGLTSFLGDLGGTRGKGQPFSKDLNGISFRPHFGISAGYYLKSWLRFSAGLNYTTITGADSVIKSRVKQSEGRYLRNLSFRSRLEEFSVNAEIYPLQMINRTHRETLFKPLIGAGVGVFHFNPKAKLNGDWVELKPLRLEGEGFSEYPDSKEYSLYQLYIPFTFGFKYRLADKTSIAFKATFRKTFSDYLDDVSQQYIDPNLFDKYLSSSDAALAKQLYYRGVNSDGTPSTKIPKPGQKRSDGNSKDSYTTLAITFTYNLGIHKPKDERTSDRVIKVKKFRNNKKG